MKSEIISVWHEGISLKSPPTDMRKWVFVAYSLLLSEARPHQSLTEEIDMLVLSRKIGESILINENVTVTVVSIQGNKVRLAIDAPRDVKVDRAEVHHRRLEFVEVEMEMSHT